MNYYNCIILLIAVFFLEFSVIPKVIPKTVSVETPILVSIEKKIDTRTEKEKIVDYIKEVFGEQSEKALLIVQCESTFNPKAVNYNDGMKGYNAYGLFQIHSRFWQEDHRKYKTNWKDNVDYAKMIYNKMGWRAWSCNRLVKSIKN